MPKKVDGIHPLIKDIFLPYTPEKGLYRVVYTFPKAIPFSYPEAQVLRYVLDTNYRLIRDESIDLENKHHENL